MPYPTYNNYPYAPYQYFPQQQPSSTILWVDDNKEAALYPVAPNAAVALFEKGGKRVYLKQADASGRPTMTAYNVVEQQEAKTEYVTRDEVTAAIRKIKDEIAKLKETKHDELTEYASEL